MINEKSGLPGDLSNLEIMVNNKDITTFVTDTYIFMDIFNPTWNCQLFINDSNNLLNECPIKQGSKIEITVETKLNSSTDAKKTFKFIVSKISDRKQINAKHYSYIVHGLTEEYLKNQGVRISHCYKNESPTNIIKKVIEDYLKAKIDKVDDSDNTFTHIFTNSSPFDAAFKMCKIGVVEKAADLMLFQTDDGKFSCRSIEKLYKDESAGIKFKLSPTNIRNKNGNIEEDLTLCINKHEWQHYDVINNATGGMMANKIVSFDFVSLDWKEQVFKYGDDVKEDGKKKQWEDEELFENENMNITFLPVHPGMHENETQYDSIKDWAGSRQSSLMKLENDKLLIQCPFGGKSWTYLGKNCEVNVPVNQSENDSNAEDEFSGKFLITAMCLILTPKGAFANYELIKKRLENKNSKGK